MTYAFGIITVTTWRRGEHVWTWRVRAKADVYVEFTAPVDIDPYVELYQLGIIAVTDFALRLDSSKIILDDSDE